MSGIFWAHTDQDEKVYGGVGQKTIFYLSMQFSGFHAPTHRRFCRWRDKGIWEGLLEKLIDAPDFEWLMIDAIHTKIHVHAAGAKGGNQAMSRTKRGSTQNDIWSWMR